MIEDLTKDKLKEYGFSSGEIKSILNDTDSDITKYQGFDLYFVSCAEQKIYTGKDATKKQLIKEGKNLPLIGIGTFKEDYFLREKSYIDKYKEDVKEDANINIPKNEFRHNEIEITKKRIQEREKAIGYNFTSEKNKLKTHLSWLEQLPTAQPTLIPNRLDGPTIALFCSIVNESKLLIIGFDESNEKFIARVASHYNNINCNPNKARQYFKSLPEKFGNKERKQLEVIKLSIFPLLSKSEIEKINTFLINKLPTNNKLYA